MKSTTQPGQNKTLRITAALKRAARQAERKARAYGTEAYVLRKPASSK